MLGAHAYCRKLPQRLLAEDTELPMTMTQAYKRRHNVCMSGIPLGADLFFCVRGFVLKFGRREKKMLYSLYETPRPLSVASEDEIVWCGWWCYVWLHVYIIKYIYIYMHVEKTAVCGAAARSYGCLFGVVSVWSGSQYEDLFGDLFFEGSRSEHGRWLYYAREGGSSTIRSMFRR